MSGTQTQENVSLASEETLFLRLYKALNMKNNPKFYESPPILS